MLGLILILACNAQHSHSVDTDTPYCSEVNDNGTAINCDKTGQPAYSCADNKNCWYDAGSDNIFYYECDRPASADDAKQKLLDYCGSFSPQ